MNARLLILGVLHRGDFHPYEIKRRLNAAMVECYIDVDVGTLYYAVRQLEKERLIEPVAHERVARGGMRTIYRITETGRTEFRDGLHRQFDAEGPVNQTLYGALLFLHLADRTLVENSLRKRIARLDELIDKLGPIREQLAPVTSTGGDHLLRHLDKQRQLDRKWLEDLLADIEANGISDVADPAKLAES
jgi:DNA-binding PadR family transcriptional regulator